MKTLIELFATDVVVLKSDGSPLVYTDGSIGLWNDSEVNLESVVGKDDGSYHLVVRDVSEGERAVPTTELSEELKELLIKQIKQNEKLI